MNSHCKPLGGVAASGLWRGLLGVPRLGKDPAARTFTALPILSSAEASRRTVFNAGDSMDEVDAACHHERELETTD